MSDAEETKPGEREGEGEAGEASEGGPADGAAVAEQRLAALEAERDEMKDRMLRIAAEFENWKKRARKEREDGELKAREAVLRDMLDVLDNLERALGAGKADGNGKTAGPGTAAGTDIPPVLKGVELVLRLFQSKLERYGVKAIVAVGQPFSPHLHEAISRVETADVPPGHVVTELQRGYMVGERLLRPSMVAVAAPPARTAAEGGEGRGSGGVEDSSA